MDSLALVASVTGLIETTRGVLKVIDELAREFRHVPTDIAPLARSLQSLMDILDSVIYDDMRAIDINGRKHSPSFQALIAIGA